MSDCIHSTGRGGAGNIGLDNSSSYADGGIVHEGVYGESKNPEYSAGRGGAGNIGKSPNLRPADGASSAPSAPRLDDDIVPETAVKPQDQGAYHTGRGGQGNAHHATTSAATGTTAEAPKQKESLLHKVQDKAKGLLHKDK
ncbi:hypothetical protein KVT40_008106 [Elsinoe batatas]|uniref:Uncharacterized protein n=1 Tax=Elsinoe batatas TaxID=2601811 RepID=A0A8K0P983_9PEZI|nr:hypothetical protein KVT40_008106 [Elsinoe batatas]